jgi:hypothetical protein
VGLLGWFQKSWVVTCPTSPVKVDVTIGALALIMDHEVLSQMDCSMVEEKEKEAQLPSN